MTAYLIKFSSVLLFLILFYKIFLQTEKSFIFNRFYLLIGLIFSMLIPFSYITVSAEFAVVPVAEMLEITANNFASVGTMSENENTNNSALPSPMTMVMNLYLAISFVLLIRFLVNLGGMITACLKTPTFIKDRYHLVLVDKAIAPYSFFNYIFLDKYSFENGEISPAIIEHEKRHGKAFHSIDVILIELALVVLWFNPIVHWLKNLILLNHEFEADQVKDVKNTNSYQKLIFKQAFKNRANSLASGFNYSFIKKRIKMLQKTRSGPLLKVKQLLIAPLLFSLFFMACEKVITQDELSKEGATTENKLMVTYFDGKQVSSPIFSHEDYGEISSNQLSKLIRSKNTEHLDKFSIIIDGKQYKGNELGQIVYSEAKEELFMRKLASGNSILNIKSELGLLGKKYRAIDIGDGNKMRITYNGEHSNIPPIPASPPAPPAPSDLAPPPPPAPPAASNIRSAPPSPPSFLVVPPPPPPPPLKGTRGVGEVRGALNAEKIELYQNKPYPVTGSIKIDFNLPEVATATLKVYDVTGKVVYSTTNSYAKGLNSVIVENLDTSGVLYYQLDSGDFTKTRKVL